MKTELFGQTRTVVRDRYALITPDGFVVERTDIAYIGMIGSRNKVKQVFSTLRERGVSNDALQRIYAPIGLDIGADSPAEIALSVMAELLQVTRKTSGGHLKCSIPRKTD